MLATRQSPYVKLTMSFVGGPSIEEIVAWQVGLSLHPAILLESNGP